MTYSVGNSTEEAKATSEAWRLIMRGVWLVVNVRRVLSLVIQFEARLETSDGIARNLRHEDALRSADDCNGRCAQLSRRHHSLRTQSRSLTKLITDHRRQSVNLNLNALLMFHFLLYPFSHHCSAVANSCCCSLRVQLMN